MGKPLGILYGIFSLIFLVSCSSNSAVVRTATDEVIDLSGRWNDTDSRLTAETMITSMFASSWLEKFSSNENREPIVIIGNIRNRSSEHVETNIFVKNIERELVNSGRIIFVAGGSERQELREEREDQQSHATEESMGALAAESGADFMLQGAINSQTDAIEGKRVTLYKVDMELVNLENNQKVWIDTKEIKKLVTQKKNSW